MLFPRLGLIVFIFIGVLLYSLTSGGYTCYFSGASPDKIVAACDKVIAKSKLSLPVAHKRRAKAYIEMGDNDSALFDLNTYLLRKPKDAGMEFARAIILYGKGYYSGAAFDLKQSLENSKRQQAYKFLWQYLAQSRGGAGDAGAKTLGDEAAQLEDKDWPYPIINFYLGKTDEAALTLAADDDDKKCESAFYIGEWHMTKGDTAQAKSLLATAAHICPKKFIEYSGAVAELKRIPITPPPPVPAPAAQIIPQKPLTGTPP